MSGYLQYQVEQDLPAGTVIGGLAPWVTANVGRYAPTDQYGPPTPPVFQRTATGTTLTLGQAVHRGDFITFIAEGVNAGISGLHPTFNTSNHQAPANTASPSDASSALPWAIGGLALFLLSRRRRSR